MFGNPMFGKQYIRFTEHQFRVKMGLKDIRFTEHQFRVEISPKDKKYGLLNITLELESALRNSLVLSIRFTELYSTSLHNNTKYNVYSTWVG